MKKKTTSQLKKQLDKVFSEYIRRSSIIDGFVYCVTCGNRMEWRESQCGHYITRNHLSTRFLEKNCGVQCVSCNIFNKGRPQEFAIYLERKYGVGILQELDRLKNEITKGYPYEAKIAEYQDKLKALPL